MQKIFRSEKVIIFSYFIFHIILGTLLLKLPSAWLGDSPLRWIDSFFTTVSAICVTGLAVVDTAQFSSLGQVFILLFIQLGGLGIVTFSTLYLIIPGLSMSLGQSHLLQEFNPEKGKRDPRHIIRVILSYTLIIEGAGSIILAILFRVNGVSDPIFNGIFHSVSAFCNGGFSRFSNSLEDFALNLPINLTIMALIILGGLGFMVNRDIVGLISKRKRLGYHSKVMLIASAILLVGGALFFYLVERDKLFFSVDGRHLGEGDKILLAFFQSVTDRTAGFNTVPQGALSHPSQVMSLLLMIIGGGSGSTAGGIKVTTAVMIFFVMINKLNSRGEVRFLHRRIPTELITRASLFFLKAMGFLFVAMLLLLFSESSNPHMQGHLISLIFEIFSALGTVGLSHGITPLLSDLGKLIITASMFAGRVGLFTMILPRHDKKDERHIDWPTGEVLIG